jgi:hypothetical protein
VLNVFTEVNEDNPHITLDEGTSLVANATGIAKASVYHSRKELKSDGNLESKTVK